MDLKWLQEVPPWDWPSDAGEKLYEVLRDKGAAAADREMAARLAGETVVTSDDIVHGLLAIVEDGTEPAPLRAVAASALGPALEETEMEGFDDWSEPSISEDTFIHAKAVLRKALDRTKIPKLVRRRALEAAVRATEEWHKEAVRQAYFDGDPEWKLTAVFCMQYVQGFHEQILESLESDDEDIFYEAVRAAGGSEVEEAWPAIAEILETERTDKPLLLAAIEAAPSINFEEAEQLLFELSNSSDPEIAEAAEEALEMARAFATTDDDDDEFFSAGGVRM